MPHVAVLACVLVSVQHVPHAWLWDAVGNASRLCICATSRARLGPIDMCKFLSSICTLYSNVSCLWQGLHAAIASAMYLIVPTGLISAPSCSAMPTHHFAALSCVSGQKTLLKCGVSCWMWAPCPSCGLRISRWHPCRPCQGCRVPATHSGAGGAGRLSCRCMCLCSYFPFHATAMPATSAMSANVYMTGAAAAAVLMNRCPRHTMCCNCAIHWG